MDEQQKQEEKTQNEMIRLKCVKFSQLRINDAGLIGKKECPVRTFDVGSIITIQSGQDKLLPRNCWIEI